MLLGEIAGVVGELCSGSGTVRLNNGLAAILLFDPRREHSSAPTANLRAAARRACQGWPRLRGHPNGLALCRIQDILHLRKAVDPSQERGAKLAHPHPSD
jgi:hypothetical protein